MTLEERTVPGTFFSYRCSRFQLFSEPRQCQYRLEKRSWFSPVRASNDSMHAPEYVPRSKTVILLSSQTNCGPVGIPEP